MTLNTSLAANIASMTVAQRKAKITSMAALNGSESAIEAAEKISKAINTFISDYFALRIKADRQGKNVLASNDTQSAAIRVQNR
ncbi:hypothetical protein JCM19240_6571 [Vibrio maritimus]|uniref:Uncharacterized protein n=1 Tax=Vibrio maritimus TaxID=990268 RepID=A0A090T337_9VIBR|nr:hypothetical protein JCM19240_6571 [Vibrio maritimus]